MSGGYTLDEAARLLETSAHDGVPRCPGCGATMWDASGSRPSGHIWLVRCGTCGRGLVFDRPRNAP